MATLKKVTVTAASVVSNDTLAGYNIYSDEDGKLNGSVVSPATAAAGVDYSLSDGVLHSITAKPVGTINGEFAAVASSPVLVDLTGTIAAPTSLTVGTPTSTTIPLTWVKSVTGVMVSYRVYDDGVLLQTFMGDVDSGTLTSLTPSTTYTNLTVRAFNGTAESPSSNAVNGTTTAPASYVPLNTSNTTLSGTMAFTAGSPAYFSGTADQGRVTAQYLNDFDLRFYLLDGFAKAIGIGFSDNTTLGVNNANTIYYLGIREALAVTLTNVNSATVNPDVPTTIAPGTGRYIKAIRAGAAASTPILIYYYDGSTETLIHTFAANSGATYIKFNTNTGRRLQNMEIR
jgi:hypothetical protein